MTIISPHKFMKMSSSDVIRFVKKKRWDFPNTNQMRISPKF